MGVRFVIGRAGSGKSHHCFQAIVQLLRQDPLGEPIYWIVPKQETFSAQRQLACGSGLGGFCRVRIVSFEQLGEHVLQEQGGSAIPHVSDLGRRMVIGHLLRKHEKQLVYYASTARQSGLAAQLDEAFAEMERCGQNAQDLSRLLHELGASPEFSSLNAKLRDLRLLYEQYQAYLGQQWLDPHRRLAHVLACLENCKSVQGATVFVDGFLEFTDYERRMLAGLARVCRQVEITLLMDPSSPVLQNPHWQPDELGLFYRTEQAYRRLWFVLRQAGVEPQPPLILSRVFRFLNPSLRQIEQNFFLPSAPGYGQAENIELIEAPDRRGEVEAAARQVRRYLEQGLRYRDVTVLMRSLDDYHDLIEATFTEHGIPFFVDRRRTAAHHPLIQFTRAAMQIALHNWPHDAVMSMLKTELAGLNRNRVDELENYVLLHRIRGGVWADPQPWTFRRDLIRKEEAQPSAIQQAQIQRINDVRLRFAERLKPFVSLLAGGQALTVRKMVEELFDLFERFRVRRTLRRWIAQAADAGRLEESAEHQQVWEEMIALLDQLVDVLGDQQVSPEDFFNILETGLERFDLAITPPTVDQVLIGTVDRTRGPHPRAVILLGMNQTQFPRAPVENPIFADAERRTLSQHHFQLDPDSQQELLDERLLGYIALTRASNYLCVMRAICDEENRPQAPSLFWARLRELFPSLAPRQIPRHCPSLSPTIGTPRQLVTALMQWVRQNPQKTPDAPGPWPWLYQWLAEHDCSDDAIDIMRYRAWRALSYSNQPRLSHQIAQQLFSSPLHASVSRIETYAACPFKHFVSYGLKLSEREEQEVTAIDLGNVYHGILEQIVRHMLATRSGWDQQSPQFISQLTQKVGQELRGELMLSSARNQHILQRIEKTIHQVVASESEFARRGQLSPWRAELGFGIEGAELPPLVLDTPAGNQLRLYGKIDRVDLVESEAAFAVIDYKLTGSRLRLDMVYHGLSLQLLTYLIVLQRSGQLLAGRPLTPIAAFYVRLLRQLETVRHPDDAPPPDDPLFALEQRQLRGIIDSSRLDLVDARTDRGQSPVVKAFLKSDGEPGRKDASDAVDPEELAALMRLTEKKLAELADRIIAGDISVRPFRISGNSPCALCEYRSVCRFDPAINRYNVLTPMRRTEAIKRALEEAG